MRDTFRRISHREGDLFSPDSRQVLARNFGSGVKPGKIATAKRDRREYWVEMSARVEEMNWRDGKLVS